MKSMILFLWNSFLFVLLINTVGFAQNVSLSSIVVPAANLTQGSSNNIIYIVKMDVASAAAAINNIQFTLTGTHDADDIDLLRLYFNASAPSLAGSNIITNISSPFAALHTYNIGFANQNIAAGTSGYFILTADINTTATNGNTIKLNGAANQVIFGYTTAATITNNQTDAAGLQTILASNTIISSSPVAASNIAQGSGNNIIYIAKMDVTAAPVSVNNIQFTLSGTQDNDDIDLLRLYFNASAPSLAGAGIVLNITSSFSAPHTYNINFANVNVAAGTTCYFILAADISATATNGNTIKLDAAANPVSFGYATAPVVINNQTDGAGTQTIFAAGITIGSSAVAASNIAQGSGNNIIYIVKTDVTAAPVSVNNIQFMLSGTQDNDDIDLLRLYFNASAPSLAGAFIVTNITSSFAAPHIYNINFANVNIPAGTTGYFILAADISASATNGNTIKLDAAANPVSFGYTTAPAVINNQTDVAGTQTILAAGVSLSSIAVAAANIIQGSTGNIIYITKTAVTSSAIAVNNIQFTLTGTYDNNDISLLRLYFNASAPALPGANLVINISGSFAAPHTYNINLANVNIAAGTQGYFILTADIDGVATIGNTIKLNGAANPVGFGYTTAPPVTDNQADAAGVQTISGPLPLSLISFKGNEIKNQGIQLQWITANEINSKDFEIEWSIDGIYFNKIEVLPATNNADQHVYNFLHKDPVDGTNYYRIKIVDKDEHFIYSPLVKINIIKQNEITACQNPVIDHLQLRFHSIKDETTIFHLQNADGKLISSTSFKVVKGNNLLDWNIQQLPAGNYFISSSDKIFKTINIIKK